MSVPGMRRWKYVCGALLALASCGGDDDDVAGQTLDTSAASVPSTSADSLRPTVAGTRTTTTPGTTTAAAAVTAPSTSHVSTAEPSEDVSATDELLAQFTEEDIARVGGIECATELATVLAAAQRYTDEFGVEPASLDELFESSLLADDLVLWAGDDDFIRPAPDSPCVDVGAADICSSAAADLAEARLTHLEINRGAPEPSKDDLVAAEILLDPNDLVDLIDGVVVAAPGGRCEGVDLTVDWTQRCVSAARTMEVAQEAYRAMNGEETHPAEIDLVEGVLLRRVSPLVDLVDDEVVATPGGPCVTVDLGV